MKKEKLDFLEDIERGLKDIDGEYQELDQLLKEYLTEALAVKKLERILYEKNLEGLKDGRST